jgi:hypothetical protein
MAAYGIAPDEFEEERWAGGPPIPFAIRVRLYFRWVYVRHQRPLLHQLGALYISIILRFRFSAVSTVIGLSPGNAVIEKVDSLPKST